MRDKRKWDLSQLTGEEVEDLKRIFRRRRCRLVLSDGLDDGNAQLNGIRAGLYQDISHPAVTDPEIPDEYRASPVERAAKGAALVALVVAMAGGIWEAISHSFTGILIYLIVVIGIILLGALAWR